MRLQRLCRVLLPAALAAGCESLDPASANIAIETVSGGASVADATCRVNNGAASWVVKTPAVVPAAGGTGDLVVSCEKPGYRSSDFILQGGYGRYAGYGGGSSVSFGLGASSGGWRRSGFGLGLGVTQPLGRPAARYPARVVVEMTPQ